MNAYTVQQFLGKRDPMFQEPLIECSKKEKVLETLRCRTYKKISTAPPPNLGNRHSLIEIENRTYFFKGARAPENCNFVFHDIVAELICSKLGERLRLSIPPMTGHCDDSLGSGFGLVSEYLGEKRFSKDSDISLIINTDELPRLFVFEQWVLNDDDKFDHFVLQPVGEKFRLWIIDHGHSLHAWRNDISLSGMEKDGPHLEPSYKHNSFRLDPQWDLKPGIELIERIDNSFINAVAEASFQEVKEIGCHIAAYAQAFQNFFQKEDEHKEIVTGILRMRRDFIRSITTKKCEKFNIPHTSLG